MINTTRCKLEFNVAHQSNLDSNNCTEHKGTTNGGKQIHYFTTNLGQWTPIELMNKFGTFQVIYE